MNETGKPTDASRRDFLVRTGAVSGAATIASGVFLSFGARARPADQAVTNAKRSLRARESEARARSPR